MTNWIVVTSFEFDAWQHRQHVNICVETAQNRVDIKVIHPKYHEHFIKGAHQSHLGRKKMGWFLAD